MPIAKRGGPGGRRGSGGNAQTGGGFNPWAGAAPGSLTPWLNDNAQQAQNFANYAAGGSYMPKWNAGDDPGYQRIASQISAQRDADAAQRRQNIQQALISFGMVPGQFSDQYGDIDDNTRGLIEKNTNTGISQYARLLGAKQEAKTALLNRISAKGLFRSGAKGKGLRAGQLDFDRSLADSMAQLMSNLGGFSSSYANNELARQAALQNAMAQAYQNYVPPSTDPFSYIGTAPSSGGGPNVRNTRPNPYQVSAGGYGPRGNISNPGGQIGI